MIVVQGVFLQVLAAFKKPVRSMR